jgi:glycosyltransferase involved in cell wall biosynthesis
VKIVFLNQYYAPAEAATAQLLSDVAEELARSGHEVVVLCGSRGYPEPQPLPRGTERIRGVRVHRSWTSGFGRATRAGRVLDYVTYLTGAAARLARESRPDAIVSLTTPPFVSLVGVELARIKRAAAVLWIMDVYPDLAFELGLLRRDGVAGRILARLSRRVLRRAERVVALGERMAERLEPLAPGRVRVIHNWEDGALIRPRPVEGHPLRAAWGATDRFIVLYSGNLGLAHEFDTMLGAAASLAGEPAVRFVVVGGGPRLAALRGAIAQRGLANVELLPLAPRERLAESLTAGDVHLVTLREGLDGLLLPSKIYGVLAAGRPCLFVGPARSEIATMLEQAGAGRRIAVGDAAGLARAVAEYAHDPARCQREGLAARAAFERAYGRARALREWRELVESLPRRNSRRGSGAIMPRPSRR